MLIQPNPLVITPASKGPLGAAGLHFPKGPQDTLLPGGQPPEPSLKDYMRAGAAQGAISGRKTGREIGGPVAYLFLGATVALAGGVLGGVGLGLLAGGVPLSALSGMATMPMVSLSAATKALALLGGTTAMLGGLALSQHLGGIVGAKLGSLTGAAAGLWKGLRGEPLHKSSPSARQLELPLDGPPPPPQKVSVAGKMVKATTAGAGALLGVVSGIALPLAVGLTGPVAAAVGIALFCPMMMAGGAKLADYGAVALQHVENKFKGHGA